MTPHSGYERRTVATAAPPKSCAISELRTPRRHVHLRKRLSHQESSPGGPPEEAFSSRGLSRRPELHRFWVSPLRESPRALQPVLKPGGDQNGIRACQGESASSTTITERRPGESRECKILQRPDSDAPDANQRICGCHGWAKFRGNGGNRDRVLGQQGRDDGSPS